MLLFAAQRLHGCGAPIMRICWIFNCTEDVKLGGTHCNCQHSIIEHVCLLDLDLVHTTKTVQVVWLGNRSQGFWHLDTASFKFWKALFTSPAACAARGCDPNHQDAVSRLLDEVQQRLKTATISQIEHTNWKTTSPRGSVVHGHGAEAMNVCSLRQPG